MGALIGWFPGSLQGLLCVLLPGDGGDRVDSGCYVRPPCNERTLRVCITWNDDWVQSFRAANERDPEAMLKLQQQLKPEILRDCQSHFEEAQKERAAAEAAAVLAARAAEGEGANRTT